MFLDNLYSLLTMAFSSASSLGILGADIALMQVLSGTDKVITNVTLLINLTEMICCAHVQLGLKI
jgi:hypothetical protein